MISVKALFLALVIGLLLCDATGALALASTERCTSLSDTVPDGKCPPLCVRCACNAPSLVTLPTHFDSEPLVTSEATTDYTTPVPDAPPHKILHVPK